MKRTFKHSIQRLGISSASLGLAVSVLFPSAAFADLSPQSSSEQTSLGSLELVQQVKPQNYAGVTTGSAPVTVIVELSNTPVNVYEREAAGAAQRSSISQRSRIRSEHSSFVSAAKRIGATPETEYSSIFNGYSVTLPGNQVDKLLNLPGVTAIYPNNEVHALADSTEVEVPETSSYSHSGKLIGADKLHELGYTGDGIQVAVVDTGIDYEHPLLKGNYKGGYDAVDKDDDPYETAPDPQDRFPDKNSTPYETSHGTHVAGTILDIAPEADIYAYRVLGPYGSGTTEDVIAGIERAVLDGADVINLSLGSDMNQSYSADSIAIDNAVKSGVNVVVAAGNAGPYESTLGSPAGAQLALTVGASTVPVTTPFFDIGGLKKIPGLIATYSPELKEDISSLSIVYAGVGSPEDFAKVDASGKVVLVDRGGGLTFGAKALNAKAAGAKVLLIANNQSGELGATLGADGDYPPTFGITQANGTSIKAEIAAGRTSIDYVPVTEQNLLADFSSTGPGLPDYLLKPDVVAPGVSINSTVPIWESTDDSYDTAFGLKQGTSMATPHVVGAVALLLDKYSDSDLNPEQIKALLMNNADPIVNRDSKAYSLYQQGAGLINLVKSINAGSIAKVGEIFNSGLPDSVDIPYYTGSLSFGLQTKGATVTKAVYVEDHEESGVHYDVSLEWLTDAPTGISVTPAPGGITSGSYLPITLAVATDAPDGAYEAVLKLTSGPETLRLPLNVLVGSKFNLNPVDQLSLDDTEISPDGDGRNDETGFYYSVNRDLPGIRFVVSSQAKPTTVIGDVYSSGETVYRGAHEFLEWGGTVTDPVTSEVSVLPDGHYWITPILSDNTWAIGQAIKFTIDTEKPVSSGYFLEEYELESPEDPRYAYIGGTIDDDLHVDLISTQRPANTLFSVYAVGKGHDGTLTTFPGQVSPDGSFGIDVEVNEGINDYLVYVSDSAGNGQDEEDYSQHLIYNTEDGGFSVAPAASAQTIEVGQPVTVDVSFSATDAVYGVNGATLGIIYDKTLSAPSIKTSVQLATYQEQKFPGIPLAEIADTEEFDDETNLTAYAVQLSEGAAYTGTGSLVQFTFTPVKAGTYSFELYNVQIWNDDLTTTIPSSVSKVTVTVINPVNNSNPNPSPGSSTPAPTAAPGAALTTGQLTETADPAGGKPAASLAVSETALTAALQGAENKIVSLSFSDVDFSKYGQVSIALTPAQAEKLKASANALSLKGKEFALIIPSDTLTDFITASGLAVTLSLNTETDTAPLSGSPTSIDIGSSSLTVKNGWKTSKPVLVQLALNADGLKDVRKTGIYQESADNNTWTYLQPGTIPADGVLQFSITGDGTYTAASRNTTFSDIGVHWAKDAVEVLAAHGIVAGKGTTASFKPADSLNQAELLTLFDRLLGNGDTWLTRIKESGSRDVLTREEAAIILADALEADVTSAALSFKDAGSISANARNAIAFAVSKGYLQGVGNNTFNPKGTLTRAQTAVILERVLEDLRNQ